MDYTRDEVITILYGIKLTCGLCRTEREALQAAIDLLEKGDDQFDCRNAEDTD